MNLEQVKNRQVQINESLHSLLQDNMSVIEKIAGVQENLSEDSIKGYPTSGLLEEISNLQNFTQVYIEKLMNYNRILCNGTFAPVAETECAQIKVY